MNLTLETVPEAFLGDCWDVPDGIDTELALTGAIPLRLVDWWSTSPDDADSWCWCETCPTTPTEAPADDSWGDLCPGGRAAHYAARMLAGDEFPPLTLIFDPAGQDGHTLLVDDGFHRISAARLAGLDTITVEVFAADHEAALEAIRVAL